MRLYTTILLMLFTAFHLLAQLKTTVEGRVTDAETGDPIPYANILFQGTSSGTTTDFDGYYRLNSYSQSDTIIASYIGYMAKKAAVEQVDLQTINFQLYPIVMELEEVTILAGENPAWPILRNVVDNKKRNDKRSLDYYDMETYTKTEIAIDQISDEMLERKFFRQIKNVMDSVMVIAGEDGQPVLPLFISESISRNYFRAKPYTRKEHVLKTKIDGVAFRDGTLISQLIGSYLHEYHFYNNWMTILEKEFVSPLADSWRLHYDYDLADSLMMGDHFCYRLDFYPKNDQSLAFQGSMWIAKEGWALKQIDATIGENANINYVEKIRIQQELAPSEAGPWIPIKNRVLYDVSELTEGTAGFLAKFYTSNRDYQFNKEMPDKFYQQPMEVAEDFQTYEPDFWGDNRHDSLSTTELNVIRMIDTLKQVPAVKTYVDIVNFAISGYIMTKKVDFGPVIRTYAFNDIEGHRISFGFRTNKNFSPKWTFKGYGAMGTNDTRFKYGIGLDYIFDRNTWTTFSFARTSDIDQVGLIAEELENNTIFLAFTRFGSLLNPFRREENKASISGDLIRGLRPAVEVKTGSFDPLFDFAWYENYNRDGTNSSVERRYDYSEVTLKLRFARDEAHIQEGNTRISLGTYKWPVFEFRYTQGFNGLLGSDLDYQRYYFSMSQKLRMGVLGISRYQLKAESIEGNVPYPMLNIHIGNESPFYTTAAFNTMNFFEFVSDNYVSFRYSHNFEGHVLNMVPLLRKFNWRLEGNFNTVWGRIQEDNINIIPLFDGDISNAPFNTLASHPFAEVGYGIENIFKIGRIDFFHRLTHLDAPNANPFRVKVSFQIIL